MNKTLLTTLLCALFLVTSYNLTEAQQTEVTGTVMNAETGNTLPGVNIVIKGTSQGTSTNPDGEYSLMVPSLSDTLVFSFVGFEEREVAIDGRTQVDVQMTPSTLRGDEVVVIGYGSVQRRDLTGSVSSVSASEFNPGESGSIQSLIQAKMSGVRVVENTGAPGGGLSVSIRGASSINAGTSPLWVVDGSPMPGGLRTFNPDNIESIEVLKDASATAIYGARAAGGVVMVTTKSGRDGPLQVDYHTYAGMNYPVRSLDLLSPGEYQTVINDIIEADPNDQYEEDQRVESTGAETDWQDRIFNRGAIEQYHSLSFSGGDEDLNYYVSMNLTNEDGTVKNSEFQRYGGRINLNYSGAENFEFGTRLNVNHIEDNNAPVRFGLNENAGAVYSAMFFDPTQPVRNSDGTFYESDDLTINNPVAILEGERRTSVRNAFAGSIFGEYMVLPNLSVRLNAGFDFMNVRNDTYISRLTQFGRAAGGSASINPNQDQNYFVDGTIRYENTFAENHDLNLLGGVETQYFQDTGTFLSAENFATDATGTDNMSLGDPETYDINSNRATNRLLSAFGRVNYTYNDKYMVTATFRADGSTRFGENNKFGYFPSFALAWQLGEEPFIEDIDFISELKPRVSWGQTGNQAIGNLLSTTTFNPGGMAIWDGEQRVGLSPARLANPDIKWETTEQWDAGIDFSLFNGRISGSFDYFQQTTRDMLMAMPLPQETGFSSQIQNVGSIANNGFEVELQTRNVSKNNLLWTTDISFSTINNEVTDLGPIEEIISGNAGFTNQFFLIREGLPLRSYYGYKVEGVWQTDDDFTTTQENVQPGNLKFADQNQDSVINADDRVYLGDSFPDFTISLGNKFSYKNFQLSVMIEGSQGVKMLNNNLVDTYFPVQLRRNKLAEPYLNRWTPDNPSEKYPSFVNTDVHGEQVVNSRTVEDASYIRLKNVQLSYSLSPDLVKGFLRSAQIYVTGVNLKTWSNYTGFNPAQNPGGDPNARIDYNAYPLARKVQLGVKLGL